MPNTNADNLLQYTKQNMKRMERSPLNVFGSAKKFIKYMLAGRLGVTLFLLVWIVCISILMVGQKKQGDDYIVRDDQDYARYFNLHRVWFGEESVLLMLFKLWYYSAILWLLSPVLRQLAIFLKVKMMM